jgi:hypothetical protein
MNDDERTPMQHGHGHGWMMLLCCVPMFVVVLALVASGTLNAGFLFYAVGCAAMMFMMMRMMEGAGSHNDRSRS